MAIGVVDIEALITSLPGVECARSEEGLAVALPSGAEQIAAVMHAVAEHEFAIEIAGAGTKRGWSNPVLADVVLKTSRLKGVREHRWQDLTATVGAGTPWAMMQRELAKHGQFVALDPLWPEQATVGGVVATNDSGALRLKYGSLRDLIIGMTIVLADGTIAKSGGKVVKNVAGYDLHKLMTGAFGTLGVIAEVTFRLHPLPAQTRVWGVTSHDPEVLGFLMMKILDSQMSVQAVQMRGSKQGCALDVELASQPDVIAQQAERLNVLARGFGGSCEIQQETARWQFGVREHLFNYDVVVKATMLTHSIPMLVREAIAMGGSVAAQATGIMLAGFSEAAAANAIVDLHELVGRAGGSIMILKANPQQAASLVLPQRKRDDKVPELMRAVKQQFDAKRMLNPGRLVGGV
ncbi:MAG TPA: FAD-binding oxidoreductase [Acidobacteriaceae bacterium]|nr:FAD-binding oxidoreductase [Acidobacteriaceae bacterium]